MNIDDRRVDDRGLDERLAALPREAEVDPALWDGIAERIRPRPARRWRVPLAAAAAAVMAAGAVLVLRLAGPSTTGPDPMRTLVGSEITAMQAAAPEAQALARTDSPEALMQAWEENRAAIRELEEALEDDPDNRLLLKFLTEARLRQARLVAQGMTTTDRSMTL